MTNKKPFYISTSIAYVNGAPHVGFAMESIQADSLARWARFEGRETFFSTGTDEHGEKIQKTAEAQNTTPQKICDKNAAAFQKMDRVLNISNDDFIRTSNKTKHWPSAQKIWDTLVLNGDIVKKEYTALYCYGCEEFKLEKDLDENGHCPNHLRAPEEIAEENYFFLLSKYSAQIAKLIETDELKIVPSFRKNEILRMAQDGFHDVSFSRPSKKLPWGVPVPDDESQNMYVWCDALSNYISILNYAEESDIFQKFWTEAEVTHVIGKDIVRFHAGIWIGMLLSAGIKLPDNIFIHGFLTSEGHKMSKSLGNVVDPFSEVEKYGADALRYFLLREVPIGKDADFSRERFEEIYQAHLANGLGNLVSRIVNLCKKSEIFSDEKRKTEPSPTLDFLKKIEKKLADEMDKMILHEAIETVFSVVDYCDGRINEEKPWELAKTDAEKNKKFLEEMLLCIEWIAKHVSVFLPETGEKIKNLLQTDFSEIPMLFPRLEKLNLPDENSSSQPTKKNITFEITSDAEKNGVYAEYVFLDDIAVKRTPKGMQKRCKKIAKEWLEKGGKENNEWKKRIEEADEIKRNLGFSPDKYINASHSLANLVEKNGKLPNFTNIVDLYNIISLKHGVSAGAHDCEFLNEKVRIDITKGTENGEYFTAMKGKEHLDSEKKQIEKGEYAFFISEKEIGCRFDSAQCEKSKILEGNKNVCIYFQAPKGKEIWAKEAMNEFLELCEEYGLV